MGRPGQNSAKSRRDYLGLALSHPAVGSHAIKRLLGRPASQDDDDAFALAWSAED